MAFSKWPVFWSLGFLVGLGVKLRKSALAAPACPSSYLQHSLVAPLLPQYSSCTFAILSKVARRLPRTEIVLLDLRFVVNINRVQRSVASR